MTDALEWLDDFLAHPSVAILTSTAASLQQTIIWMRQHRLGRKRILDTHLAAVLHVSGVRRLLTSNVADFAIFSSLEAVAP